MKVGCNQTSLQSVIIQRAGFCPHDDRRVVITLYQHDLSRSLTRTVILWIPCSGLCSKPSVTASDLRLIHALSGCDAVRQSSRV